MLQQILRLVHIVSAIMWAGGSLLLAFVLTPALRSAGPAGNSAVRRIVEVGKLPMYIGLFAGLTLLAGLILYWRDSGGFHLAWITSPSGMSYTIGAISGIAAQIVGGGVTGRTIGRISDTVKKAELAGRTPDATEEAQIFTLWRKVSSSAKLASVLLIVAAASMALARFAM